MAMRLKPSRGGFMGPLGCGLFIRDLLSGFPMVGAPQSDIFRVYKETRNQASAYDQATQAEERNAKKEKRSIDPDNIERLAEKYLARMPYKANGCRYHSFVVYFSSLRRLGWVEPTGYEEPSAFQDNYSAGQPRRYYRLTEAGINASDSDWANPQRALYGRRK